LRPGAAALKQPFVAGGDFSGKKLKQRLEVSP
jgi:hypothetical protein